MSTESTLTEEFERVKKTVFTEALTIATGFDHHFSKKIAEKLIAELEGKGVRIVLVDFDKSSSELTDKYETLLSLMMEAKDNFTLYDENEINRLSPGERSKYRHAENMSDLGIGVKVKEFLKLSWSEVSSIVANPTINDKDPEAYRLLKKGIADIKETYSSGHK